MVEKLGTTLLEKETITLPDLVDTLGQRPFPLKASLRDYLEELRDRVVEDKEAEKVAQEKMQAKDEMKAAETESEIKEAPVENTEEKTEEKK